MAVLALNAEHAVEADGVGGVCGFVEDAVAAESGRASPSRSKIRPQSAPRRCGQNRSPARCRWRGDVGGAAVRTLRVAVSRRLDKCGLGSNLTDRKLGVRRIHWIAAAGDTDLTR